MILTVGAGAVGTVLLAHLSRAVPGQVAVYARAKDKDALSSVAEVRIDGPDGRTLLRAPRPALAERLDLQGVDHLLVCTKHAALEPLLDTLPPAGAFPPGCTVVSTLNGVDALRLLRRRLPGVRIVPMTIMFNAQWLGPLHAQLATRPALVLGGEPDARLAGAFAGSGMSVTRAAGDEAVWGKLLVNLANAICAVTHASFRDMLTDRALRECCALAMEEALAVLDAAGIAYAWPMPIPPAAYLGLLRRGGPVTWWLARAKNGLRENSFPSMVADVEQGRPTEVLLLNGEIERLGASLRRPTPVARRLVALVAQVQAATPPRYLRPADLLDALRTP